MQEWRNDELVPFQCAACATKGSCGGGCKAQAAIVNMSLAASDPLCRPNVTAKKEESKLIMFKEEEFVINAKITIREEEFGGIVFLHLNSWAAVSEKLYLFIVANKGKKKTPQKGYRLRQQEVPSVILRPRKYFSKHGKKGGDKDDSRNYLVE